MGGQTGVQVLDERGVDRRDECEQVICAVTRAVVRQPPVVGDYDCCQCPARYACAVRLAKART